jgi:hypothetical protein
MIRLEEQDIDKWAELYPDDICNCCGQHIKRHDWIEVSQSLFDPSDIIGCSEWEGI